MIYACSIRPLRIASTKPDPWPIFGRFWRADGAGQPCRPQTANGSSRAMACRRARTRSRPIVLRTRWRRSNCWWCPILVASTIASPKIRLVAGAPPIRFCTWYPALSTARCLRRDPCLLEHATTGSSTWNANDQLLRDLGQLVAQELKGSWALSRARGNARDHYTDQLGRIDDSPAPIRPPANGIPAGGVFGPAVGDAPDG